MKLLACLPTFLSCLLLSRLTPPTTSSLLLICVWLSRLRDILLVVMCLIIANVPLLRFTGFSLDYCLLFNLCSLWLYLNLGLWIRLMWFLLLFRFWFLLLQLLLSDNHLRLFQCFQDLFLFLAKSLQLLSLRVQGPLMQDLLQELLIFLQQYILDNLASWWKWLNCKGYLLLRRLFPIFLLLSSYLITFILFVCVVHRWICSTVEYLNGVCSDFGQSMDILVFIRALTPPIRTDCYSLTLLHNVGLLEGSTSADWEFVLTLPFLEVDLRFRFKSVYKEVVHDSLKLGKLLLGEILWSLYWVLVLAEIWGILIVSWVIAFFARVGLRTRSLRHGVWAWWVTTWPGGVTIRRIRVGISLTFLRLDVLLPSPRVLAFSSTFSLVWRTWSFRVSGWLICSIAPSTRESLAFFICAGWLCDYLSV